MAFISGTSGNDTIHGTATNDDLRGQNGNDVVIGGDGNDYMEGNAGHDSLFGGAGNDNMRGNDGDDVIAGADGNDFAAGGAGHDSLHGEAGNDNLQGEAGNDLIIGGSGDDYVGGGDGDDLMYGEDGGDLIEGFRGNDTAFGGNGDDHITDSPLGPWGPGLGNDAFFGGSGNDTLNGGTGNDSVFGGDGDDVLIGDGAPITVNTTRSFSYVNNFDGADALMGATQTLFGGAPGVSNVLNSPDDDHDKEFVFAQGFSQAQAASLAISPNLAGNERVASLHATFVIDMAAPNWQSDWVDGMSINFGDMSTLPANREYENGVHSGLAIRLDPLANVTEIRWNGAVICAAATHNLESRNVGSMAVSVTSAGVVSVTYAGDNHPYLVATIPANQWATANQSGWQFGFAGRTGHNAGFIYIDDVNISAHITGTSTAPAIGNDFMDGGTGNDHMLGEAGNDSMFGGNGNDTLFGGEGGDQIDGGAHADTVDGGAGHDTLTGGRDHDTLDGGDGDDSLDGGQGTDAIYGGLGNDTVDGGGTADGEGDTLFGGAGDDLMLGGAGGQDLIYGGAGRDKLQGGFDIDTLFGGDDNDLIYGSDPVSASVAGDTIFGGLGEDTLYASSGPAPVDGSFIDGGQGADVIYGGSGNDTLQGGDGNNLVFGGAGNDIILTDGGNDEVDGGDGDDAIQTGLGDDVVYGGNGSDWFNTDAGNDTIYGGDGDDTDVIFNAGNDLIYAGAGNDVLGGYAGDDTVFGESGNDDVTGGTGNDALFGGDGDDFLNGGDGDDLVNGGAGDNYAAGGAGNDIILTDGGNDEVDGGDGDDAIQTGLGDDVVYGGAGNDWLNTDSGDDTIYGGDGDDTDVIFNAGNDLVYAGAGNDVLGGYAGDDTVFGESGNDDVTGGAGNDALFGGDGNDFIIGGAGDDIIAGDAGDDTISAADGFGSDTVFGGEADEVAGDMLNLSAMTTATQLTFTDSQAGQIVSSGANMIFADIDMIELGSGADSVLGDAADNAANSGAGNDLLNGGAGSDRLDGGAGDDLFTHSLAQNTGANDVYNGNLGTDELHLSVTAAEWANPLFQTDVAAFLAHIASGSPAPFVFAATGLTVISIERFTINIDGVPTDPVNALLSLGADDIAATEDGGAVAVNLLANDAIEDRAGAVQLLGGSAFGTLDVTTELLATPQTAVLVFTPNAAAQALRAGQIVVETITYQVTDVDGNTATAAVTLTLTGANDAATITGLSAGALTEDGGAPLSGVLSVLDVDTGEAAFAAPTGLAGRYGTFAFDAATGAWSYTPNAGAAELDSLDEGAQVTDQFSAISIDGTAAQTVTITITGTNDAPTLTAAVLAAVEDGPSVSVNLATLGDDIDAGEDGASLTYTITSAPSAGTATLNNGVLTYAVGSDFQTLAQGDQQDVAITVTATDAFGAVATNTVTITITGTNDAPTLAAAVLAAVEDGPSISVNLATLGDDIDAGEDGASLTYTITSAPSAGTATLNDGVLTYAVGSGFQTLAQGDQQDVAITVTATDAFGAVATNTVTITITGTNDAPTLTAAVLAAVEDGPSVSVNLATLGDDIDAGEDGASLTYTITSAPSAGTATLNDGVLTYAVGSDFQTLAQGDQQDVAITVTATDAFGAVATNTVTITITGTNDAPTLAAGLNTPPTVGQNSQGAAEVSGTITFADIDLNDTHTVSAVSASGNLVTATIGSAATGGALGVLGWAYTVDPQIAVGAQDTITISLSDGNLGGSIEATLVIDVPAGSTAPDVSAPMQVFSTIGGGELPEDVNLYFTDPNLDTLTAAADPGQSYKGLTFNGSAQIVFNPDNDAYQFLTDGAQYTAFFTFLLSDGTTVQTAQIEWTITGLRSGIEGTDDSDDLAADLFTSTLINGGAGDDTMTGSALDDVFAYFAAGDGFDLITNFELGQDKIGVSATTFGGNLLAGEDATVFVTSDFTTLESGGADGVFIVQDNGTSATLYWDADGGLGDNAVALAQLDGVVSLTSDDFFIFV